MPEKRIEIVRDENSIITFEQIETDSVDREEVALIEERIERIRNEIADKNAELEGLLEKVAFAKHIIALADEKKALELEEAEAQAQAESEVTEEVTE